jgi:rhamnulokinase
LPALLIAAAELPADGPTFDPDDPGFLPPGDMPARIEAACRAADQPVPGTRPALVRCILDSLAAAYGRAVAEAVRLSGQPVDVVHLVGGGARNALLCQLTADACGLPVIAGPVEATALGNVLVQARARGLIAGDLESLRALIRSTQDIRRFEPRPSLARRGA